jgi:hypothetical protein
VAKCSFSYVVIIYVTKSGKRVCIFKLKFECLVWCLHTWLVILFQGVYCDENNLMNYLKSKSMLKIGVVNIKS